MSTVQSSHSAASSQSSTVAASTTDEDEFLFLRGDGKTLAELLADAEQGKVAVGGGVH